MLVDEVLRTPFGLPWPLRGVLILHLSLGLSFIGLWVIAAARDLLWAADFSMFYTGWTIVLDGQGGHLYDLDLQHRYQLAILHGRSPVGNSFLPFNYPPHTAVLFAPLALLPRPMALGIWTLAQAGLLVYLFYLLHTLSRDWTLNERWFLMTAVAAFFPLLHTFLLGALSLLTLVCVLQIYLTLKRAREDQTWIWLIIGTLKPQAVALTGMLLLGARRWRTLGYAALAGVALVLLTGILLGWQAWVDFWVVARTSARTFDSLGIVPAYMYNFKGTLTLLLGKDQRPLINLASGIALITAVGATLWIWRGKWQPDHPRFEVQFALTVLLGVLFSPHLFPQDSLMLVAPAVLFYSYLRQRGLPRRAYAAVVLLCPVIFLASLFFFLGRWGFQLPVAAMLVLLVWMGRALLAERAKIG